MPLRLRTLCAAFLLAFPLLACIVPVVSRPSTTVRQSDVASSASTAAIRETLENRPAPVRPGRVLAYVHRDEPTSLEGLELDALPVPVELATHHVVEADAPLSHVVDDLRMHAARSNAEVLALLSFEYDEEVRLNGWFATSILLFPLLAVPWATVVTSARVSWDLVDVRSGAFLASGRMESDESRVRASPMTIESEAENLRAAHRSELYARFARDINETFLDWPRAAP